MMPFEFPPPGELVKKVRGDKRIRLFEYQISYTEI